MFRPACHRTLDLEEMYLLSDFDDQIDFQPVAGPQIIHRRHRPRVNEALEDVGDDERFEESAEAGAIEHGISVRQSQEITGQRRIVEVQLWTLDEPLAEILVIGIEEKDLVAGFENGQPPFRRRHAHPDVPGHVRKVEDLSRPDGADPEEPLELAQIADLG